MHHCTVIFAAGWDCSLHVKSAPTPSWKVEAVDVIKPTTTAIATEDIKSILIDDTGGPASLSGFHRAVQLHLTPPPQWTDVSNILASLLAFNLHKSWPCC